jgi:hypothetical protein
MVVNRKGKISATKTITRQSGTQHAIGGLLDAIGG